MPEHKDSTGGLGWSIRAAMIGSEMAMPAVVGWLVDMWLNTLPWVTVAGTLLGFALGMTHVFFLAKQALQGGPPNPPRRDGP
jgi:F0F1-type ATP synthase assembly protein I